MTTSLHFRGPLGCHTLGSVGVPSPEELAVITRKQRNKPDWLGCFLFLWAGPIPSDWHWRGWQCPAPGPQGPASLPAKDFCCRSFGLPGPHSQRSCMGQFAFCLHCGPRFSVGAPGQSGGPQTHHSLTQGATPSPPGRIVSGKEPRETARELLTTGPYEGGGERAAARW